MTEPTILYGCAPEPLIHYLKALGVLRLVAEQLDPQVRGAWLGDAFALETSKTKDEIVSFFLNEYRPTPIVAPWNNGSGFHAKEDAKESGKKVAAFRNIKNSTNERLQTYRDTITKTEELLVSCMTEKIARLDSTNRSKALKPLLVPLCRNNLSDEVVRWIDAICLMTDAGDLKFPPLLGSAGNDGNLEFSLTFMGRLYEVLPTNNQPQPKSERQLRSTMFSEAGGVGTGFSPGQFHPGGSGGPNATTGIEANFLANPWDYILAVEGAMIFAGAAVRRLAAGARAEASFPFFVRHSDFGSTASRGEENRGELFLPLWERPASLTEVMHLFSEGRVRLGKKQARTTVDFARSIAELGVDRGITRFHRHAFFTRNGKMQFASSLGSIEVKERKPAALVNTELSRQLDDLREATKSSDKLVRAFAEVEEAIFNLSAYDIEGQAQIALTALGKVESEVALRPNLRDAFKKSKKRDLRPLSGLSTSWAWECWDGSAEFEIAAALAAIRGDGKRGAFRTHLEPVEAKDKSSAFEWTKDDTGVVWQAGKLEDNLAAILHRRSIDARAVDERATSASHPQLQSRHFASLESINKFLSHETDDDKIEALLRGLSLINWSPQTPRYGTGSGSDRVDSQITKLEADPVATAPGSVPSHLPAKAATTNLPPTMPRAYALLKLLFLPNGKLEGSSQPIRHEPAIVPLLRAGRVGEALAIAERRLRSTGLTPFTSQLFFPDEDGARLAAALLIPINETSASVLAATVLRPLQTDM